MKALRRFLVLLAAFGWISAARADGTGTNAAAFLDLSPESRAAAMGNAFAAMADDATALVWNPAGLGRLDRQHAHLAHMAQVLETQVEFAAYARPTGRLGTFGAGVTYLHSDDIPRTAEDSLGAPVTGMGDFSVRQGAATLGWGRRFGRFAVGGSAKYLWQQITDVRGRAYAVDAGMMYAPLPPLRLALGVNNLGTQWGGEHLPTGLRAGAVYGFKQANLSVQADKVWGRGLETAVGAEWWFKGLLALRAGYRNDLEVKGSSGLRFGMGFLWKDWGLDYAFVPYGDLGHNQQFSLRRRWR